MEKIISKLNQVGKDYINKDFVFHKKESFLYVSSGNNISSALNIRRNNNQLVNVSFWFADFWLYVELRFVPKPSKSKKSIPSIFFSLSIFQGAVDDREKNQLFRAEWDNYKEQSTIHPQPHWHVYTKMDNKLLKENFVELVDSSGDSFEDYIKNDSKPIDINKFHFAINGQWSENNSDVHEIRNEEVLAYWFAGILNHIKKELKYLKEK